MAIKLEGGGGKALMAWPLVEVFFAASLKYVYDPYNARKNNVIKKSSCIVLLDTIGTERF